METDLPPFYTKRVSILQLGKICFFFFLIKKITTSPAMCRAPGERSKVTQKGGYMCTNKASPNRKGLRHIASSLKEIAARHVRNVPHDSESQKRSLHFQMDTEVNISHHQAT